MLWVTDELDTHSIVPAVRLLEALRSFHKDPQVFLPKEEVTRRIRRLSQLVQPSCRVEEWA